MGNKKDWFVDQLTQNILELIDLTYRVSHHYASDHPQVSVEYDAKHHTLVVCIKDSEWVISIKQQRRYTGSIAQSFDEVKRTIQDTYPVYVIYEMNRECIEQIQMVCLKHIDLNREASRLESFFKFNARNGVLTSTIQNKEGLVWQVSGVHRGRDVDYITVVDAHHTGYSHLSYELSQQHIERYIGWQLKRLNGVLDDNRRFARNNRSTHTDVSLLNCMKWQKG